MATRKNSGRVLIAGTLDTKGEELAFLRDCLAAQQVDTMVADFGVLGEPKFSPDISRDELARLAGESAKALREAADRGRAVAAMHRGFAAWCRSVASDPPAGVISIGGSAGTDIATAGMRELPVGIPKLMVSTMASGDVRPYVGTSDITMMYSVADFTGLNRLTRTILANAAYAIGGMSRARSAASEGSQDRLLLAATMFGVTTPCVNLVKELVEREGCELLVFHATGTGGQAMEKLVRDGFVKGVLDITTTELADELVGGVLTAGPDRLEAAGAAGVPQVVSVGALDMVNFGAPETVPDKFRGRKFYPHNPNVTLMRTTREENGQLGEILARKVSAARGPVTMMLPLGGVSAIDAPGKAFYDPEADGALFDAIRKNIAPSVRLVEHSGHINDPAFADRIAREFIGLLGPKALAISSEKAEARVAR